MLRRFMRWSTRKQGFYKLLFCCAIVAIICLSIRMINMWISEPEFLGIVKGDNGSIFYYSDGIRDNDYTGLFFDGEEGYYFEKGRVAEEVSKLYEWQGVTWYIENGKVARVPEKLVQSGENLVLVKNGILDTQTEMIYKDGNNLYYIKDGRVVPDVDESVAYDGKLYCFKDGKLLNNPDAIDPNGKMVALTFDDGPYTPVTSRILDTLEKNNARATFFVVGTRVDGCAELVKKEADMGCIVANHTWDHSSPLTDLGTNEIANTIEKCSAKVEEVTGRGTPMVRPVGGSIDEKVVATVKYPMITWDVDSKDWKTRDANSIHEEIMSQVTDGSIILMHDLYDETANAVDVIVPELIKDGYQLVTVEELAFYKGEGLSDGAVYTSFKQNN